MLTAVATTFVGAESTTAETYVYAFVTVPAAVDGFVTVTFTAPAACGHDELYFQKDFNRATGITLVVIGAILAPFTYFISLLLVTILDWTIWRLVKNVVVCYRCQAVHRGYDVPPSVKPFDLATHDRHVYGAAPPGAEEGHN